MTILWSVCVNVRVCVCVFTHKHFIEGGGAVGKRHSNKVYLLIKSFTQTHTHTQLLLVFTGRTVFILGTMCRPSSVKMRKVVILVKRVRKTNI